MSRRERIPIRVWHANPVLQAGLLATLAGHDDLDCGEGIAADAPQTLPGHLEVVVADHARAVRWARAHPMIQGQRRRPRIMVVAHSDRASDIRAALTAGVHGYVLIDDAPTLLAPAVRALRRGERVLSPRVASRVAESLGLGRLTGRENDVLRLVVDGCSNKSIANDLGVGVETVKTHLRAAFGKLGVTSRTQAAAVVTRCGLL